MEKKYYSIKEVAELLHLNASTLRFWESKFSQLKPKMSAKGTRRYMVKDIEILETIIYLTRDKKLTIEGAQQRLKIDSDEETRMMRVVTKLKDVRSELIAIRHELNDREALSEEVII